MGGGDAPDSAIATPHTCIAKSSGEIAPVVTTGDISDNNDHGGIVAQWPDLPVAKVKPGNLQDPRPMRRKIVGLAPTPAVLIRENEIRGKQIVKTGNVAGENGCPKGGLARFNGHRLSRISYIYGQAGNRPFHIGWC